MNKREIQRNKKIGGEIEAVCHQCTSAMSDIREEGEHWLHASEAVFYSGIDEELKGVVVNQLLDQWRICRAIYNQYLERLEVCQQLNPVF